MYSSRNVLYKHSCGKFHKRDRTTAGLIFFSKTVVLAHKSDENVSW